MPPPGDGLTTVTLSVPAAEMSDAFIAAVSCDALTNVVIRGCPFHSTVETPPTKPLPLTVSVKAAPPTSWLGGLKEVIAGAGLLTGSM